MQPEQAPYQPAPRSVATPTPVQYAHTKNVKLIVLEIVIVILVIIGAFVGGMSMGKSSENAVMQAKLKTAQAEVTTLKKTYSGEAINDIPGATYLNIKEWNIRLPLDAKFKDVKYRIRNRLNADFVEFYSPSLAAIAVCRDYQGEIGTVERATNGTVPITGANTVGVEKYLYMYQEKPETCTSNPANLEAPYKASVLKQFMLLDALPNSQREAPKSSSIQSDTLISTVKDPTAQQ